jgi:hypothetical protein
MLGVMRVLLRQTPQEESSHRTKSAVFLTQKYHDCQVLLIHSFFYWEKLFCYIGRILVGQLTHRRHKRGSPLLPLNAGPEGREGLPEREEGGQELCSQAKGGLSGANPWCRFTAITSP